MYVAYNEAAAISHGKKETYESWFELHGIDKNEIVTYIGGSKFGYDYIRVSRPKGNWSQGVLPYIEVHREIYLPVVLDKDLGDYL